MQSSKMLEIPQFSSQALNSTPCPDLLVSNRAPTAQEEQHIRLQIEQMKKTIPGLDEKLAEIRQALHQLSSIRHTMARFVQVHTSILSPMRKFPPEIWTEIFTICCAQVQGVPLARGSPHLVLTSVCRNWRSIMILARHLWSTITFRTSFAIPPVLDARYDQLQTWISRSDRLPLMLRVEQCQHAPDVDKTFLSSHFLTRIQPALELMVEHCSRWYSADLFFLSHEDACRILEPIRGNIPILNRLRLQTNWFAPWQNQGSVLQLFADAPSLQILDLQYHFHFFTPSFPWKQLTACNLTKMGIQLPFHGISILRHAPCLTTLRANYPALWRDENIELMTPVEHKALRRLVLIENRNDPPHPHSIQLGQILDKLNLPALTELVLTSRAPWCHQQFLDFTTRSRLIVKLELHVHISPAQLLQCLRVTPLLVNLILRVFPNQLLDPFLDAMSLRSIMVPPFQGNILPALHTLTLVGPVLICPKLLDMIESRCQPNAPAPHQSLKQVDLDFEGIHKLLHTSTEDLVRLGRMMKQDGFQLKILRPCPTYRCPSSR